MIVESINQQALKGCSTE